MPQSTTSTELVVGQVVLPESANMSLPTFINFVSRHALSQRDVGQLVEMVQTYHLSIPYVGKMLQNGKKLSHINAAYALRAELPPLYDANVGIGDRASEFGVPVEKACEFLSRIFREEECDEDSVEATVRLMSEVANRCPQIQTWSSVLEAIDEVIETLTTEVQKRAGDLLDIPPFEKIELMLVVIDELELIADRRI